MMSENIFYFYLFISIIWFYVGSLVVWKFAVPELYKLLIKGENVSRSEIIQKEQEKRERKQRKRKA
jgi:Sec-independent protein secretion pathway component TatC